MAKKEKFIRLSSPITRAGLIPYILNDDGTMDVCTMIPSDPMYGGDMPQMAKGRIDDGFTVLETAIKEAEEELGFVKKPDHKVEVLVDNFSGIRIYCVQVEDKELGEAGFETGEVQWVVLPEEMESLREWQIPIFQELYEQKG